MKKQSKRFSGFSLIELVIVVVIIAIIGAIAIPKMSRGAAGAGDAALLQDLAVIRSGLDLYLTENNNTYPSVANLNNALTWYNDGAGTYNQTKDATHIYGPYLRAVPPLPVGLAKGGTTFAAAVAPMPTTVGWVYNSTTGVITTNTTTETDLKGNLYNGY